MLLNGRDNAGMAGFCFGFFRERLRGTARKQRGKKCHYIWQLHHTQEVVSH